ncbi:MAG: hypothetical protein AB1725_07350 [Armatimonadota bacterium]
MVLATLAILSLGPTVTHQANAVRVGDLVASLAEQSALPLDCSPALATEPVVTEFRDRPLEEVLDALAWVVGAEWEEREGRRTLVRSSSLRARLEREEREMRARWWRAYLDEQLTQHGDEDIEVRLRRFVQMYQEFTSSEPQGVDWLTSSRSLAAANPIEGLVFELLDAIGEEELAGLEAGDRVVYSDNPTPMQRQLPRSARRALARLALVVRSLGSPDGWRSRSSSLPRVIAPDAEYGKTLLILRGITPYGMRPRIVVASSDGRVMMEQEVLIPPPLYTPLEGGGAELQVSSVMRLFARLQQDAGYAMASGGAWTTPEGRREILSYGISHAEKEGIRPDFGFGPILRDPVAHDPTGVVLGSLLRQCAVAMDRPLVAAAPDDAVVALGRRLVIGAVGSAGQLIAFLSSGSFAYCERAQSEWLLLRPAPPVSGRVRFSRDAAKRFISTMDDSKQPTLEAAMRYVSERPGLPSLGALDRILISHSVTTVDRAAIEVLLTRPVELLAVLGVSGRSALQRQPVPFARLDPIARDIIHRWTFRADRAGDHWAPPDEDRIAASEPTERYPHGVPADTLVSLEVSRVPGFIATTRGGYLHNLSLYEVAMLEAEAMRVGSPEFALLLPAQEVQYVVRVEYPDGVIVEHRTQETVPQTGAAAVPRDRLPEALRRRLDDLRAYFRGGTQGRPVSR